MLVGCVFTCAGCCSRAFAKAGYSVALIARNPEHLKNIAGEIVGGGGDVSRICIECM